MLLLLMMLLNFFLLSGGLMLSLFNICVTYLETTLLSNVTKDVANYIKHKNKVHDTSGVNLEEFRQKHQDHCDIIKQHDDIFKFPIGVILTSIIIQSCIVLFGMANASNFIDMGTIFYSITLCAFHLIAIFSCGITLNNSVSNILFCKVYVSKL